MTDHNPAEEIQNQIQSLEYDLKRLQSSVRLSEVRDQVEDLQTIVNGLDRRLGSLRERGYPFESELEERAADFEKEWSQIEPELKDLIDREARGLERDLRPLEGDLSGLKTGNQLLSALKPRVEKVQSQMEALEGRVEAAGRSARGMYDQFHAEVRKMTTHLDDLEWMLTELSEASFDLLATESGIRAAKAAWARGEKQSKEDPQGVLYLTDQRLLFEQKEKVATKKILFIATEKEQVQELKWEVPVELIQEIKTSDAGFLKRGDYLEMRFDSRAALDAAQIRIWQPGEIWVSLINRAQAREFDAGRAIPLDKDAVEQVENAPTKCSSCGGTINQPILRGMDSITCEYCGSVIRW